MNRPDARTFKKTHRKMRHALERLDQFLQKHENRPGHADHLDMKPCRLRDRVATLLEACVDCYEFEERGFKKERRLREVTRSAKRYDALLAEHRRILIALRAIGAACEVYCEEKQRPGPRLLQWIQGTVTRAQRHEDKEEAFFQGLFYQELGGLD